MQSFTGGKVTLVCPGIDIGTCDVCSVARDVGDKGERISAVIAWAKLAIPVGLSGFSIGFVIANVGELIGGLVLLLFAWIVSHVVDGECGITGAGW